MEPRVSVYEVIEYLFKQGETDMAVRVIKMCEGLKTLEGQLKKEILQTHQELVIAPTPLEEKKG